MNQVIENYRHGKEKLLLELEEFVRTRIESSNGDEYVAKHLPFWGDGIANPEIWFNSLYRPLFILKESNIGLKSDTIEQLKTDLEAYNEKWKIGPERYYMEFVEDRFSDVYIGKYETWKNVARLSVGLENNFSDRRHLDLSFNATYGESVSLEYLNSVYGNSKKKEIPLGYREKGSRYKYRTGNTEYIEAVDHIAVINIKKIGSGDRVNSFVSQCGIDYRQHLEMTSEFLKRQIKLIDPTDIVCCCGPDNDKVKEILYKEMNHIRWISASHPGNSFKSYEDFFADVKDSNDL